LLAVGLVEWVPRVGRAECVRLICPDGTFPWRRLGGMRWGQRGSLAPWISRVTTMDICWRGLAQPLKDAG